jgi:hypothetical protein
MSTRKRGGRRSWPVARRKAFALRFYAVLCERFGEQAPFERLKAELARSSAQTRESTIRGWLPPLERLKTATDGSGVRARDWSALRTPDLSTLVELSRVLDVSVDYLLGADVPRRVSDRLELGNPGAALLAYVVRDYIGRATRQRRDGLAAAVGGRLSEREVPDNPEYIAKVEELRAKAKAAQTRFRMPPLPETDWPQSGDVLPDGCIVTNRLTVAMLVLEADAQGLLRKVCDNVYETAEAWEESHKEAEREAVRKRVAELIPDAAEVARAMTEGTARATSQDEVLRRLLWASQSPLDSSAQTWINMMWLQLRGYRKKQARLLAIRKEADTELEAILDEEFGTDEALGDTKNPPADA